MHAVVRYDLPVILVWFAFLIVLVITGVTEMKFGRFSTPQMIRVPRFSLNFNNNVSRTRTTSYMANSWILFRTRLQLELNFWIGSRFKWRGRTACENEAAGK